MDNLDQLKALCLEKKKYIEDSLPAIANLEQFTELKNEILSKKGFVNVQMSGLRNVPNELKKEFGQEINNFKVQAQELLLRKEQQLKAAALNIKLEQEELDLTLPARKYLQGSIHPVTQTIDEVTEIMARLGFSVEEGPEIENEDYNFTKLNTPKEHPARQMHDTFYVDTEENKGDILLRTHTSPVQIRTMLKSKPPIRIISPGRTFRCDSDATHTPMFHQMEALYVDKDVHLGHLKYTLLEFLQSFFEVEDLPIRFRPSYFPFTEPSMEVDIGCSKKQGRVEIGKGDDFLEILGAGMVNPNVLKNVGIDPEEYQGFAFGLGIERLAMLKYGAPDLRAFFNHDVRWLQNYSFDPLQMPSYLRGK